MAAALLREPLLVSVFKLPAAAGSSRPVAAGAARPAFLMGTVEVDLSALLWPGSGDAGDAQRSTARMCPLLSCTAAERGCAALAVRVQLQLAPAASAAQQAAAAEEQGLDVVCVEWQAGQPGTPAAGHAGGDASTQRLQKLQSEQSEQPEQEQEQWTADRPDVCISSSDDDEALLQRCQRLLRPNVRPSQPQGLVRCTERGGGSDDGSSSSASSDDGSSGSGASSSPGPMRSMQEQHRLPPKDQGGPPPSGGQPDEQQAPAAGAPAGVIGLSSGGGSHQEQHSAPEPAGADPASTTGLQEQQAAHPAVQQQGQRPPADSPGKLLVQVETALHLPEQLAGLSEGRALGGGPGGASYAASVQVAWQQAPAPGQQRVSAQTRAVAVHAVEAADLGGTAVWQQELELGPVSAAAWTGGGSSAGGEGGSGPSLLVNVWAASADTASAGAAAAAAPAPAAPDVLVGCATVDISGLPLQAEVRGWFQLVNSRQQRSGQVKLAVRPDGPLQRQLAALAADACAAQPGPAGGVVTRSPIAAEHAADLQQQLAAQLEELELLSRRLAAGPGQRDGAAAAGAVGPQAEAAPLREVLASDDEMEGAPFDARQVGEQPRRRAEPLLGGPFAVLVSARLESNGASSSNLRVTVTPAWK